MYTGNHVPVTDAEWAFVHTQLRFNRLQPGDAYMRQSIRSSLVQVMACRLVGTKPLPEPVLIYSNLKAQEQTFVKLNEKHDAFHQRTCIWKCHLQFIGHFVSVPLGQHQHFACNLHYGYKRLVTQTAMRCKWSVVRVHKCTCGLNTLRPRQDGRHFLNFLKENVHEFPFRIHWRLFLKVQLTIFQH